MENITKKKPIKVEKKQAKKPIKVKNNSNVKFIKLIIISSILMTSLAIVVPFLLKPNIETVKNSVVLVNVYDENGELMATGSGFSAYKRNWIVTNFHVIEGAYSISIVTDDKKEIEVEDIIIFNKKDDLAIISIDGELKPLKLGNGKRLKTKEKVTAIGSPMGELNTVSEGIISNIDEKDLIRISVPISHGSSGGVLLNNKNQVIGITSAGYDNAQNLNFAININVLDKIYTAYKNKKYFTINNDNYDSCIPNIVNHNTQNELSIKKKCSNSDYYNNIVSDLTAFYKATNSYEIFNSAMYKIGINGLNNNYKNLTINEQKLTSQYYTDILKYEDCDSNSPQVCKIDNVSSWTAEQMVLELDILTAYELAIFKVEIEKYKGLSNVFNYVNSLTLSSDEKSILSILYGGYRPSDLNNSNAKSVISYIGNLNISLIDKHKMLEYLGYTINGDMVYW